jgi:hypothetical protein
MKFSKMQVTPTNIPIELSYYIASYITSVSVKNRDLTDPSTMLIMNHGKNSNLFMLSVYLIITYYYKSIRVHDMQVNTTN